MYRHILAVAVACGAQVIVTSNLRDFPPESMSKWGIEAMHPDHFLLDRLDVFPPEVISKLHDQAATIDRTPARLLSTLRVAVPQFAAAVASRLGLNEP